jgi:hypothetical protein
MSGNDFLNKMREAGEKYSEDPVFLTVAKMRIQLGYSGFVTGERPANFFKPYGDPKDAKRVSDEVSERLSEVGSKRAAVFAVLFDIPEETNTGAKVDWDIKQVAFVSNDDESEYQIFFSALAEGDFPINEWFWGSYKNLVVGEYEKDGETKKRYLSVPVEKFANEAAARAAASASGEQATTNSKWSETAQATYEGNMASLEDTADELLKYLELLKKGTPFPGYDLPQPLTPVSAKKQIAEIYGIETTDIDLLIPF